MKRATFSEKYRIAEALKELVTKDGDGCRYSEGNNDTSLAKTLGMPRGLVQSVRQELYGALSAEGRSAVNREAYTRRLDEFGDRIAALEQRVSALEDEKKLPQFPHFVSRPS